MDWAPRLKLSHRGLVLADDLQRGSYLSWGDRFGVGKGGVEVEGVRDRAAREGRVDRGTPPKPCY